MSDVKTQPAVDLSVDLAGLTLANPVMTASGTCGYGLEYGAYLNLRRLGAFVTKSITLQPRAGNAPPRVAETRAGLINSIGLANVGLQRFLAEKLPQLGQLGVPVFVNVAGQTPEEYVQVAEALDRQEVIKGIEMNISCPNVKKGGLEFGRFPDQVRQIVSTVRQVVRGSLLIVKLTPNVSDIVEIAAAAVEGGADVLSMVNTLRGMAIDVETRRPLLGAVSGGLSGPAIKPTAVFMVHQVYSRLSRQAGVPIIGMGGIQFWQDAVEFMLAGATAVAVGTALFVDPRTPEKIIEGLTQYCRRHGIADISQLVGKVQLPGG